MFIPFLIIIISFTSLYGMDKTQIRNDWSLYKELRLKSVKELTAHCQQSSNVGKIIDLAEYARDGHLMAKLMHICLPKEVIKTHIAPHLIEFIATQYKHSLIKNRCYRNEFNTTQMVYDTLQTLSRHDGTYSIMPNIGHTYTMWNNNNENKNIQKSILFFNQQKHITTCQLTSTRNNITDELHIKDNGELILSRNNNISTRFMHIIPDTPVTHYCLSNDNSLLALGHEENEKVGIISITNTQTGEQICRQLNGSVSVLCSAHYSPLFVVGSDKPWFRNKEKGFDNGLFIKSKDNRFCFLGHDAPMTHAEFSPDDKRLITCSYDETKNKSVLKLFDTSNTDHIKSIIIITKDNCHADKAFFICNGEKIIYLQKNGEFHLLDGSTGKDIREEKKYGPNNHWYTEYQKNYDPIILWNNKHKLIIRAIADDIQFFSSENGEYIGAGHLHSLNDHTTGIGITTDENSIIVTDSHHDCSQRTLYDKEDMQDIEFIEQQANIIQLYEMLNLYGLNRSEILYNTSFQIKQLVASVKSYIRRNNMHMQELDPINSTIMNQMREIFIIYFMDLYEDVPVKELGIDDLYQYLDTISEKNKIALAQNEASAFLVYIQGNLAGFAICSLSEDSNMVLLRTMPITFHYNDQENVIRQQLLAHIKNKFPQAKNVVMLVRKANAAYRAFCKDAGFVENNDLFVSKYIQKTYDPHWYDIYEYRMC